MNTSRWLVLAVSVASMGCAERSLAGPLGSDANAAYHKSEVYAVGNLGQFSVTVDAAAYAPGTVIGHGVPTSAARWTYAYQIFDSGATFDRVRLDTIIGGTADLVGLAPGLGQTGGLDPSQQMLHFPFGLPSADYFTTPVSGMAFTTTVYFTSQQPPTPGLMYLRNGSETAQGLVGALFGAVYTPAPAPGIGTGLAIGLGALMTRRRRR